MSLEGQACHVAEKYGQEKSCLLQTDLQQEDTEDKKLLPLIYYYLFNNKNLKKMLKISRVRN